MFTSTASRSTCCAHGAGGTGHVEQALNDPGDATDLAPDGLEPPTAPLVGHRRFEKLGVTLDDAHRRPDLVSEPRDEASQRREALRCPGALGGPTQLDGLALVVLGEPMSRLGQLAVQVLEIPLPAVDVGLHGDLGVEEQQLLERRDHTLHTCRVSRRLVGHERQQERQVERVGTQVPARLEPDLLVGLADTAPVAHVVVVDHGSRQAQEIGALLDEQPLLHLRVGEQPSGRAEGQEMAIEGRDEALRVLL